MEKSQNLKNLVHLFRSEMPLGCILVEAITYFILLAYDLLLNGSFQILGVHISITLLKQRNTGVDTEKYLTVLPLANWPRPLTTPFYCITFLKTFSPLAAECSPAFSLRV